jgi:outer membrane protein, heavy metal efflux system
VRRHSGLRRAGVLLPLALAGCARYVPQPIDLSAHPAEYRARRLDDPRVLEWVGRWSPPDGRRWTDRQLALAALGFRADLTRARAEWRAVVAGEASAAARPQPGVATSVEHAVSGSEGQSPWVVSLTGLFSLELGGKRGARLQQARARSAVAEAELRFTAWRIAREVRAAAHATVAAEADVAAARREVDAIAEVEGRERARFQEASLSSAELARTGTEVQAARAALAAAEAEALAALTDLAAMVGVPARVLDSVEIAPDAADCAPLEELGADSLAALALTRRPEMSRVLAEYAVAESGVRLEVARQYPDLDLGPGFIWDQGVHRWTLALSLPNLLRFRNRAPIAQAEADRAAAGTRVAEAQEALVAEVEAAIGRCRGSSLERAAADSQVAVAERASALAQGAYQRGETSSLEPVLAALAVVRAERLRGTVLARTVAAARALETAAGAGEDARPEHWPDPRADSLVEGASR